MTVAQIVYLSLLGACVFASGFFSGSETALVAIPRERVSGLVMTNRRAARLEDLTEDPDRMLSTLLIANNFVNILGASVATVLFVDLLGEDWGPWTATAAVTAVVLLVGEITPKSLATRYPERYSVAVAPIIWRLSIALRPVSRFFLWMSRGIFRLLRIDATGGPAPITEEDIRAMAVLGERSGDIETAEREIIHSLFALADRHVREVMTPRTDILALDMPVTLASVREAVAASGHSRFPVINGDLDHPIGILHVKDLLRMPGEPSEADIRRILREPYFVPETKPQLELLHELRLGRRAFAIVLDEHGGVEGLVTVKDLVGELVGDLQDEFDPGLPSLVGLEGGEWMADGRIPVGDLAEALGRSVRAGPYTTIGGLILDLAGRIPTEGEMVEVDGLRLIIVRMDRHRVDQVRIVQTEEG
jgi:putative hemolysin